MIGFPLSVLWKYSQRERNAKSKISFVETHNSGVFLSEKGFSDRKTWKKWPQIEDVAVMSSRGLFGFWSGFMRVSGAERTRTSDARFRNFTYL
jgi:hypothetical protein